jgi:tripartite-type tricarboxylate transporter receptor subunit TctC
MSEAEEWRERVAELRQFAELTEDAERHQKLLELADRWEEFAKELGQDS